MPPTGTLTVPPRSPRYKMRLNDANFLPDHGGKLPAGAVVIVDEETAVRWLENNIAEQAPQGAQTFAQEQRQERESRRQQVRAQLVPIDDDEEDEDPPAAPARRSGRRPVRRGRPTLEGAAVNTLSDDDAVSDEDDG